MIALDTAAITTRAREIHPGQVLLTAIAAVVVGTGWLVGKTVTAVIVSALWLAAAVSYGYAQARPKEIKK